MPAMTKEESLLLQCLATTSLLGELSNADFFQSEYFEELAFANEDCKNILKLSGIGNPATMQMMLYALLVVPSELIFKKKVYETMDNICENVNQFIKLLVVNETTTYAYTRAVDVTAINYMHHLRNSVAHSQLLFETENRINYVTFTDRNPNNDSVFCSFKMETQKVGLILMELQKVIMEYYNKEHSETA